MEAYLRGLGLGPQQGDEQFPHELVIDPQITMAPAPPPQKEGPKEHWISLDQTLFGPHLRVGGVWLGPVLGSITLSFPLVLPGDAGEHDLACC